MKKVLSKILALFGLFMAAWLIYVAISTVFKTLLINILLFILGGFVFFQTLSKLDELNGRGPTAHGGDKEKPKM